MIIRLKKRRSEKTMQTIVQILAQELEKKKNTCKTW